MAEQWIRQVGLQVQDAGGTFDLSEMRIRFDVKQRTIQTPNSAVIRVYNLSKDTVAKIQKIGEFAPVQLSAGYVSNCGVIFRGTVKQINSGRETPVDTFVDIFAAEGDEAYNWAFANKTLAAGSTALDHVNVMADTMKPFGIKLGYVPTALLTQIKYPRAVSFFGMAKDYLRIIGSTIGCQWSIQEGELTIVEKGKNFGGAVLLNSDTGLIGRPIQTADAIYARCLINPQIKLFSQVKINQADINKAAYDLSYTGAVANATLPSLAADGIYTVWVIEKIGDTHAQPWYFDMMLLKAGAAPPPGSSLLNQPDTPYIPQES